MQILTLGWFFLSSFRFCRFEQAFTKQLFFFCGLAG